MCLRTKTVFEFVMFTDFDHNPDLLGGHYDDYARCTTATAKYIKLAFESSTQDF